MKTLIKGIIIFAASMITFTPVIATGILWSIPKAVYLTYTEKWYSGLWYFILLIDAYLNFIGRALYNVGIDYDILANEHAEFIEDTLTYQDKTPFGVGNQNTISASTGWLLIVYKSYYPITIKFKNFLNKVFNQKEHCEDSWRYKVIKDELQETLFKPLNSKD